MFKTGLKIFIVVAAISAIVLGYYYFFQRNKNVPDAYGIFIQDGPLLRINNPVKFWDALDKNGLNKSVDSIYIQTFASLQMIKEHESVKNIFISPQIANDKLTLAVILENYSSSHAYNVVDFLKDSVFQNQKIVEKEKQNLDYFAVYYNENPIIYFTNVNGILLICFDADVLHSMAKKVYEKKPIEPHKLINTANSEVIANLFFYQIEAESSQTEFCFSMLKKPYGQSKNFVFDLYLKDGALLMSGLSDPITESLEQEIAKLTAREFDLSEVIPEDISMLYQLSADGLATQFVRKELINEKQSLWLESFSLNEYSFFKSDKNLGIGIKSKGKSNAIEALKSYDQILGHSLTFTKYSFDKEISFEIAKGNFQWLEKLLPGFFNAKERLNYAVATGDYVVFSNNYDELKQICRNTVLNRNLKSSYKYEQHKMKLSSASNTLFYSSFDESNIGQYFGKRVNAFFKDYGFYDKFEKVAAQSSGSGKHLYNQIVLFGQSGTIQKSNVNWKTKLSASASFKPVVVKNHTNSDDEIFVQDENNYIYLITRKGRVLWQKMIDGQILSDVYQVDKYKNQKLQYIFNTTNKVYLIDRNGNDVERFPISLPVVASAGLSVFDYDENQNYRIFLPLKDKRVRLYDLDANLISGWEFDKADAPVTTAIQHYRFDGKDYIVFGDTLRMYILNRKGETRIKPEKLIGKSSKNKFYFDPKKSRWVSTTPKGTVFSINIAGEVEEIYNAKMSHGHYFMMKDLSRNGHQDYIFVNKNELLVLNYKFENVFKYEFPNNIIEPPAYYLFSRHKAGIGIVDKLDGKVFMFKRDGKQFSGFPYPGITPFTISVIRGFTGFQLIVGNLDGFLYDYQLQ
jgi:hypothetical protein